MRSKTPKIELTSKDKELAIKISSLFGDPLDLIEAYLKDLLEFVAGCRSKYYIPREIHYDEKLSGKEALTEQDYIKYASTFALLHIYRVWKISVNFNSIIYHHFS